MSVELRVSNISPFWVLLWVGANNGRMKSRSRNRLQACGTGDRSLRQLLQRMSLAGGFQTNGNAGNPPVVPKKKNPGPRPTKTGDGGMANQTKQNSFFFKDILRDIHKPVRSK